jgi:hypothetical protein
LVNLAIYSPSKIAPSYSIELLYRFISSELKLIKVASYSPNSEAPSFPIEF